MQWILQWLSHFLPGTTPWELMLWILYSCWLSGIKNISLCLGKSWLGVLLPVSHAVVGLEGLLLYEHVVDYFNSLNLNLLLFLKGLLIFKTWKISIFTIILAKGNEMCIFHVSSWLIPQANVPFSCTISLKFACFVQRKHIELWSWQLQLWKHI